MNRLAAAFLLLFGAHFSLAADLSQIRMGFAAILSFLLIFILVIWIFGRRSRNEAEEYIDDSEE